MINQSCFGGEEAELRDTFYRIRLVQFITALLLLAFLVTTYFTVDCYIYNLSHQCIGSTFLTVLFGVIVFGICGLLIRWKWYWKETPVQEEESRTYGEITPKMSSIGRHESQRVSFNPVIHNTQQDQVLQNSNPMTLVKPLEIASSLLSNPLSEHSRSRSSSKDSSSSKKMSKTSKKSSKHILSPKSPSAISPKLPNDSEFTIQNPMDRV
jgi:hypothetical protein